MRANRKDEILACCGALERLANKITEDWELDQTLNIEIEFLPNEPVTMKISKRILPKELIKVYTGEDVMV